MFYHYKILILFILPVSLFGQTVIGGFTFTELPKDKQLYARDVNNKGTVLIEGQYDRSGNEPNYDRIQITVDRDGIHFGPLHELDLIYTGDIASFSFSLEIDAELSNYSFDIRARQFGIYFPIILVTEVVAGDVYIIEGQSNAEAFQRPGMGNANVFQNNFIRVYASGTASNSNLLGNDNWYVGDGNVTRDGNGNTGQWGLKLAYLLVQSEGVPIAIFNGARGGQFIFYFLKNYPFDSEPTNNYERLLYRLEKTGLKNAVKGVFWSQGENVTNINSVDDYKNAFLDIKSSWSIDYPSIEQFYIFQIRTGCASTSNFINLMQTKEAERQLAMENLDIHIMATDGLTQYSDTCHFMFTDGYEEFANRIYNLVMRDFYGGLGGEIEPPNIIDAFLSDDITLIVQTDASGLTANSISSNFELANAGSASISNIDISGSQIIFTLSENPGPTATISNLGSDPGTSSGLITGVNGLEIVAFYEFPIDSSRFTIWSGNSWSNNVPDASKYAIISDDYSASIGNIITNKLTINSGANLNFDSNTTNSVVIYGDLSIDGTFTIGDEESLVMYKPSASISGNITKLENSTSRNNTHDFTYWSSSVTNASIASVFPGVTPGRIFRFDQSQTDVSNPIDPDYYKPWLLASGSMIPGMGYAAEGISGTTGVHVISITGTPNNGNISVPLEGNFGGGNPDPDNDFNLIGNPYASAINIDSLFEINSNLDGNAYLWTHFTPISGGNSGDFIGSDYAIYNLSGGSNPSGGPDPTNNIGSGQGFFVRATSAGFVNFTNNMRMEGVNDQFYKSNDRKTTVSNEEEKDRIWLRIETDQGGINQVLIAFNEKATIDVDRGYDALMFKNSSNPISFYSMIEDNKYTIQGLGPFSVDKRINLGFDTKVAPRMLTISIKKLEGKLKSNEMYLVDHLLNVTHDLRNSKYIFEQIEIGENKNRFTLQFSQESIVSIDEIDINNSLTVSNTDYGFLVKSNKLVQSIEVYDILGRKLIDEIPNKKSFVLKTNNVKKGSVLIIIAQFKNGSIMNKKVIKY